MPPDDASRMAMALLMRPVRHAVNNLSMVLSANLDSALPKLPAGERATAQITRARAAAEDYDRLVRGFLALGRDEAMRPVGAERFLRDLLPLLTLAAGGPLDLEATAPATIRAVSPTLDAALVLACAGAAEMPSGPRPPLRLDGGALTLGWPVPAAAAAALTALGASLDGATIGLPTG